MRAYRDLFGDSAARWPLITSGVARLTPGMVVLSLVLAMRAHDYPYAAIGLVAAGHQIGVGVGSPLQGRLADRFGQRRVIAPDAVAYLAGLLGVAALLSAEAGPMALLALALVTGALYPPVTACARVLMSRLFPGGRERQAAYAVTGMAVELGFVLGPMLAVLISLVLDETWALALAAVPGSVGSLAYVTTRAVRSSPQAVRSADGAGALSSSGVRIIALALAAIAVTFGVFDVTVPAVAELAGRPQAAGLLIPCIASGALIGSLVYGSRTWAYSAAARLAGSAAALATALLAGVALTVASMPAFAVSLFLAGLFIGPATITSFQLIDDLAPVGAKTEAQSWTQSGIVVGVAVGATCAGVLVDQLGPRWSFVFGGGSVALGALLVVSRRRRLDTPPAARALEHSGGPAPLTQ